MAGFHLVRLLHLWLFPPPATPAKDRLGPGCAGRAHARNDKHADDDAEKYQNFGQHTDGPLWPFFVIQISPPEARCGAAPQGRGLK